MARQALLERIGAFLDVLRRCRPRGRGDQRSSHHQRPRSHRHISPSALPRPHSRAVSAARLHPRGTRFKRPRLGLSTAYSAGRAVDGPSKRPSRPFPAIVIGKDDRGNGGETVMPVALPLADADVLARRAEIVAALKRMVPGEGVIAVGERHAAVRERWPHRLSPASDGGRAAGNHRTGRGRARLLSCPRHQGGAARGGHLAVGGRAAARRRRPSRHGQVQSHPRARFRQPGRRRRAGRHQSRHHAKRWSTPASITRPIRRRRSPAPSAATSRRIPAACTVSNTA